MKGIIGALTARLVLGKQKLAGRCKMRGLKYEARLMGWRNPANLFDRGKFPHDISHLTPHEVRKLMRQYERGQKMRRKLLRPSEILGT